MRRSDPASPGWGRHRAGRGFVYLDTRGRRLRTVAHVAGCRQLTIPPAWTEVWICPEESGHIQAVGTDAAGRRRYLLGPEASAKDFRTCHATVLTAVTLAASGPADGEASMRRHVTRTIAQVGSRHVAGGGVSSSLRSGCMLVTSVYSRRAGVGHRTDAGAPPITTSIRGTP